jgi:hypothetical protein
MTDAQVREDALQLLRAARDTYVEQYGGNEKSFTARTALDLAAAGQRTGLPTGYDRHERAVEWLESEAAIERDPVYQRIVTGTIYRITARGVEMLRDESMFR